MIRTLRITMAIVAIVVSGCQSKAPESTLTGRTMGTTYTVRIGNCTPENCGKTNAQQIDMRLEQLEEIFSHYRAGSEISRFNQHHTSEWFPVSREFTAVAQLALDISRLSEGAFDVTVAPAVNAWGFGPGNSAIDNREPALSDGRTEVPGKAAIQQATEHTDYRQLEVRAMPPALRKFDPELTLDMSAIAKGYAVDQISYLLESQGTKNYLVEIGGELRTAGTRPGGKAWRIAIEPPDVAVDMGIEIEFIVQPGNNAVATSGDYRNYFEYGGKRYSHTIDPATGRPVNQPLASVSVIAPSAAQADALATALLVLGTERGLRLANDNHIAALFIERDGRRQRSKHSTAFNTYLLATP